MGGYYSTIGLNVGVGVIVVTSVEWYLEQSVYALVSSLAMWANLLDEDILSTCRGELKWKP